MAYEPNEWACGDIITAEKMNAMERGIADMNAEYVPNEWSSGETITAEKLNHMEQGIANGGGSSDFSTAEVTIINNLQSSENINMPCIVTSEGTSVISALTRINSGINTINVPLYKDGLVIVQTGAFELLSTFSGDVSLLDQALLIFGECSLALG